MYTKLKLSSRSRSVSKVFNLENNLINIFITLTSAAKYIKISHKTLKYQLKVFTMVGLF